MPAMSDFAKGDIVGTHPATDAWMRGCRYGQVTETGRKYVYVDFNGLTLKFVPDNLIPRSAA